MERTIRTWALEKIKGNSPVARRIRQALEGPTPESQRDLSTPENFRGDNFGYFPNRIVEETSRVKALREVIGDMSGDSRVEKRLFDLIIYNAFGRVYPIPNSAGDFVGVVNDQDRNLSHSERFKNCIVIGKVNGQLAVLGGFHDVAEEESMAQTIAREGREEALLKTVDHFVFVGERSRTDRDPRFPVVSTVASGIVKASEIHHSDDAEDVFIVPLTGPDYKSVNTELLQSGPGTLTVLGPNGEKRTIQHNGFRADHLQIVGDLYKFWTANKVADSSLSDTVRQMSAMTPQEWFRGYKEHPEGQDNYKTEYVDGKQLLLTPNIQFVIDKAATIFNDIGIQSPQADLLAKVFAARAVERDALPLFPQAAVTLDCVIVKGNDLIVYEGEDEKLSIPGTFYSPEKTDVARSIVATAQQAVSERCGVSFDPALFLGTVGGDQVLGHQADSRYPRLSSIYAGIARGNISEGEERILPDGRKIRVRKIPIWADASRTAYSPELLNGVDGKGWMYEHSEEILQPLLQRVFSTLNYDNSSLTAEGLLARHQFGRNN